MILVSRRAFSLPLIALTFSLNSFADHFHGGSHHGHSHSKRPQAPSRFVSPELAATTDKGQFTGRFTDFTPRNMGWVPGPKTKKPNSSNKKALWGRIVLDGLAPDKKAKVIEAVNKINEMSGEPIFAIGNEGDPSLVPINFQTRSLLNGGGSTLGVGGYATVNGVIQKGNVALKESLFQAGKEDLLFTTIAHELGHVLQMGHTNDPEDVMYHATHAHHHHSHESLDRHMARLLTAAKRQKALRMS